MRTSQLLEALGTPDGLPVVICLLESDATQRQLLESLRAEPHGNATTQPSLSALMTRLLDIGLVKRERPRSTYSLVAPQATRILIEAVRGLLLELRRQETHEMSGLHPKKELEVVCDSSVTELRSESKQRE